MSTVLAIPDLHIPFHSKYAFDFIKWCLDKYQPDEVVLMGDELDWHSISYHDHDPDGLNPGSEYAQALKCLNQLWAILPKTGKGCYSNHGSLPQRKMKTNGLPSQILKSYKQILNAPEGWNWSDAWEIDNVQYIHGQNIGLKTALYKAVDDHKMSTVFGHVHAYPGVQYRATAAGKFFGMNTGCLVDRDQYAFSYSKLFAERPVLGVGIVIDGKQAHFIPMGEEELEARMKTNLTIKGKK